MKVISFFLTALMLWPAGGALAVGAGGGAGMGTAVCTADTYSCAEWGNCQNNARSRKCVLSFDCPGVETPAPVTEEKCGSTATCTGDTWECSEWGWCNGGVSKRTCQKTVECLEVEEAAPAMVRPCTLPGAQTSVGLKCGNLASLKERVRCRLRLSQSELAEELKLQYLPEECRPLKSAKQENCLARYESLQPCWDKPVGAGRASCAAKALGIIGTPLSAFKACAKLTGVERARCQAKVRDKAYALIKFRLYDLSERAEAVREKGVALEPVVKLVTAMEQLKQDFNKATAYARRRALILKGRNEWRVFVAAAKGKERTADYLDAALRDLATVR